MVLRLPVCSFLWETLPNGSLSVKGFPSLFYYIDNIVRNKRWSGFCIKREHQDDVLPHFLWEITYKAPILLASTQPLQYAQSRLRHERILTDRSPFPSDPLLAGWLHLHLATEIFSLPSGLPGKQCARALLSALWWKPIVALKKKKEKIRKRPRDVVGRIVTEGYWERKELKGARRQMPPHRSTAVECRVKKKAIIWQSSASDASVYSALLTNASCCCCRRRLSLLSSRRQWSSGGARD